MVFSIINPKIKLEIKLEEIQKLHIHEEVVPSLLEALSKEIRTDGHIKHPIMVDKKSHVVLDGIHRLVILKNLNCRLIPVCLVEYDNPNISVGCWYRVVDHSKNLNRMLDSIRELGFTIENSSEEESRDLISQHKAVTSIVSSSESFAVYGPQRTIKEIYNAIKKIEFKLRSQGYTINYETENHSLQRISSNDSLSMFIVPKVSKREVIETALKGEVFAPKTTRHIIPARPLFVNAPMEWLCGNSSIERINEVFFKHLSKKRLVHLSSDRILNRHYEEDLYVFR